MVSEHISAPSRARADGLLSADNQTPERHIVMETLREAASKLGLTAPVLATLDAMLSCLPPKRNHHVVFASNDTLCARRNGISDRTIRRHIAALAELGLLERRDSANRKRFKRYNPRDNMVMMFGFDLGPLFTALPQIARIAASAREEQEEIAYLRCQIRAHVAEALRKNPEDDTAHESLRHLRRKLTRDDCEALLRACAEHNILAVEDAPEAPEDATNMTGTYGQNVRHHQRSNKELIEKTRSSACKQSNTSPPNIPLNQILSACPEAMLYAQHAIKSEKDIIAHARTMAPMLGISQALVTLAEQHIGPTRAALAVWIILQMKDKVRSAGAYFRALTIGPNADGFDPARLITRLAQGALRSA